MRPPTPWRFFRVVLRPPPTHLAAAGLLLAYGLFLAWDAPGEFDQTIGLALFLHMFVASSGYSERAIRGHFDPILTGRRSRLSIAQAHWAMSAAPGLATWLLLAGIDLVGRPRHWPAFLTLSALAAFAWVSVAVWTVTLRLIRYAGGVLWLVLVFVIAAAHQMHPLQQRFLTGDATWTEALPKTGVTLLFPAFLVSRPQVAGLRTLALVFGAAVAVWAVGAWLIVRFDGVLRDGV